VSRRRFTSVKALDLGHGLVIGGSSLGFEHDSPSGRLGLAGAVVGAGDCEDGKHDDQESVQESVIELHDVRPPRLFRVATRRVSPVPISRRRQYHGATNELNRPAECVLVQAASDAGRARLLVLLLVLRHGFNQASWFA
jgi:hypothetical protein